MTIVVILHSLKESLAEPQVDLLSASENFPEASQVQLFYILLPWLPCCYGDCNAMVTGHLKYFLFVNYNLESYNIQVSSRKPFVYHCFLFGPHCEKNCLRGFRQSEFQTSLLSYRD